MNLKNELLRELSEDIEQMEKFNDIFDFSIKQVDKYPDFDFWWLGALLDTEAPRRLTDEPAECIVEYFISNLRKIPGNETFINTIYASINETRKHLEELLLCREYLKRLSAEEGVNKNAEM